MWYDVVTSAKWAGISPRELAEEPYFVLSWINEARMIEAQIAKNEDTRSNRGSKSKKRK